MTALWSTDYDAPAGWQAIQQATPGRITVTPAPGYASKIKPAGNVVRVDMHPSEPYTDGRSRAEMYARTASPMTTPADQWPDPPGSTRWYDWALLVPLGFTFAADTTWLTLTQWKGLRGGSPPIAIEIKRQGLRLGGARANTGLIPTQDLGPIKPGSWTRLTVGIHYATDQTGWVHVYRDGRDITQANVATLDVINGQPDPCYLKQGIYRDTAWTCSHTLYFGPVTITDTSPV